MAITFETKNADFSLRAYSSKSLLHRELIVTFLLENLKENPSEDVINNVTKPCNSDNEDIKATRRCLRALWDYKVSKKTPIVLNVGESGSIRFMIPVSMAYLSFLEKNIEHEVLFETGGKLYDRPLDDLALCLAPHGVEIGGVDETRTVVVKGSLEEGVYEISGLVSSQYISGLLMALIMTTNSSIRLTSELKSASYYELTIDALERKQIVVNNEGGCYSIKLPESLDVKASLEVEADWSATAFLLCLAAVMPGNTGRIYGLYPDSKQGDRVIVDVLTKMGVSVTYGKDENGSYVEATRIMKTADGIGSKAKSKVKSIDIDCKDFPDIVPYIAVCAASILDDEGEAKPTVLRSIGRLKVKESDRVAAMIDHLALLGAKAICDGENLYVYAARGISNEIGNEDNDADKNDETISLKAYNDHRMAMTSCLVSKASGKKVRLDNASCVAKSFPRMWEMLEDAGVLNIVSREEDT